MEPNQISMPGYRYNEYLLVLNPHEDLRSRIINIRKEFHENYNTTTAFAPKPHITLVMFKSMEMMEDKIVNRLKITGMGTAPFKVILNDYGSFPSHTIFINVTTKLPIQNLVKELKKSKKLIKSPENDPYFSNEPYITIARKLNASQYNTAWTEYAQRNFTASFIADGMLLLKRGEGEKAYRIVQRLEFMNLPVSTKQGELFG